MSFKHVLDFKEYAFLESKVPAIGLETKPEKVKVHKDEITGLPTIDKTKVPMIDQLKVLARELYHTNIEAGRAQTLMMDKITALQQMGADDGIMQQIQQMQQDQMQALQMKQMNLEMHLMSVAGNNMAMAEKAQQLASESKFLADRANEAWFKKRSEKIEKDVMQQMKQKQQQEAKKKKDESDDQEGEKQPDSGEDKKDK